MMYYGSGVMGKIGMVLGIMIVIGIISFIKRKSRTFNTTTLVLSKVKINRTPENDVLVFLKGRPSGFISWVLSLMKLAADGSLLVSTDKAHFNSTSLSGDSDHVVSLKSGVSSVSCEYHRPITLLIWAAVLVLLDLIGLISGIDFSVFIMVLFFPIVLFLVYYFNQSILICIETKGGVMLGLKFKPSFIENINMDMNRAKEIVEIINQQVIALQAR